MRWVLVVSLGLTTLGCAASYEELVERPQDSWLVALDWSSFPAAPTGLAAEPVGALPSETPADVAVGPAEDFLEVSPSVEEPSDLFFVEQQLLVYLSDAKAALKARDLATAAASIEQALALDPTSEEARTLQRKLEQTQRKAEERARRTLIALYQDEGLAILRDGDTDRALVYFEAAQELDPTNRKTFKLTQRAYETQHTLMAKRREEAFKEHLRQARAADQEEALVDVSAELTRIASLSEAPRVSEETATVASDVQPLPQAEQTPAEAQPLTMLHPETPALPVQVATTEQGPEAVVTAPSEQEYTIQPEDVLQITVYQEPDLATRARVTSAGEITFPLIGRVAVAGWTVQQVEEELTKRLAKDYLTNPQVQVFIESYHPRYVFVTGAVNKPSSYPLPSEKPTTIMEVIAMAGGFSEEAALNGTRIIRIENGDQKIIQVKASDIIKKGDKSKDVTVRPNDIIFVPESFF